jgi:hypothetical protein
MTCKSVGENSGGEGEKEGGPLSYEVPHPSIQWSTE